MHVLTRQCSKHGKIPANEIVSLCVKAWGTDRLSYAQYLSNEIIIHLPQQKINIKLEQSRLHNLEIAVPAFRFLLLPGFQFKD